MLCRIKRRRRKGVMNRKNGDVKVEKAGYLAKWTNYIKGYRQRWFVLDSNAILSYYRNQHEVSESCRGSVNLQEARVLSDKINHTIIIATNSQTFHLKAQNDVDRQQWLQALEYGRHKANKRADSEDDEEATLAKGGVSVEGVRSALNVRLEDLRTAESALARQTSEIVQIVNESTDKKLLEERVRVFKLTSSAVIQAAEELHDFALAQTKKLERVVSGEHKQSLRLQEQLETLAKQHSHLERAAARSNSTLQPPFGSDIEDEFHDAEEEIHDRKSTSSVHDDSTADDDAYFSAEIVTPPSSIQHHDPTPHTPGAGDKVGRVRRLSIPNRPDLPLNLWSIMRNCIGKELSKIPMPVNFSEPLSVLQRITEDLEYAFLLSEAAKKKDSLEQMCLVAAYAVSSYSTTGNRTTKPFNPLLGETYECDRMGDLGWRSLAEQVSHHPPAAAHHAAGNGWQMFQDFTMTSRFRGKYLSVIPVGHTHVVFSSSGNHYTYKKVTTTVHNIIVGKLWIDNHGEMEITNHTTGDKCLLKFIQYSYFSREVPRKVTGLVRNKHGEVKYLVQGTWDANMDMMKVLSTSRKGKDNKVETDVPVRLWNVHPPHPNSENMYHFTKLAVQLNEPEEGVAPTDSRNRPDQRLMEEGKWDEANTKKLEVEEKQRTKRRLREAEMEKAMERGDAIDEVEPLWFERTQDELTGSLMYRFNDEYWKAKERHDWSKCPDIF